MRLEYTTSTRGYIVELNRDLFGAFILSRRWYGLNNRRGGIKQQVFLEEVDAMREVTRIQRTRTRHGYQQIRLSAS